VSDARLSAVLRAVEADLRGMIERKESGERLYRVCLHRGRIQAGEIKRPETIPLDVEAGEAQT